MDHWWFRARQIIICHDPQHASVATEGHGRRLLWQLSHHGGLRSRSLGPKRTTRVRQENQTHSHLDEGWDTQSSNSDCSLSRRFDWFWWWDPWRRCHRHWRQTKSRFVWFLGIEFEFTRQSIALGSTILRQAWADCLTITNHDWRPIRWSRLQQWIRSSKSGRLFPRFWANHWWWASRLSQTNHDRGRYWCDWRWSHPQKRNQTRLPLGSTRWPWHAHWYGRWCCQFNDHRCQHCWLGLWLCTTWQSRNWTPCSRGYQCLSCHGRKESHRFNPWRGCRWSVQCFPRISRWRWFRRYFWYAQSTTWRKWHESCWNLVQRISRALCLGDCQRKPSNLASHVWAWALSYSCCWWNNSRASIVLGRHQASWRHWWTFANRHADGSSLGQATTHAPWCQTSWKTITRDWFDRCVFGSGG